jgi:LPS O-antigen subunit length determinant protein (WzzB/FepE family)
MADIRREPQPQHHRSGMLSDILFALFRRKWTIVFCTLLGLAAAAAAFHLF